MALLKLTDKGLYCEQGNFYIDPLKPVEKAIITHAHSDHAKAGHGSYLCHPITKKLLQVRLGKYSYQSIEWGESLYINGIHISLHPAGHVAGSSQIRLECMGEVWVASGDYKTYDDEISGLFEPIQCNTFITESTFGLPVYQWKSQKENYKEIQNWILNNQSTQHQSIFFAYSLGKAQRIAMAAAEVCKEIYVHASVWNIHQALREIGIPLPEVHKIDTDNRRTISKSAVIIAPASASETPWMKKFGDHKTAYCSGWMLIRGQAKRNAADYAFAISDHADWNGLLSAIENTNAEKVLVTHGFTSILSKYLNENGKEAYALENN
jgi:putative mRNA 3-end processing factor